MNFNGVLFDLDGVVIDSNQGITNFWRTIAADYGVRLRDSDFIQYIYGCPARETLNQLFPNLNPQEVAAVHGRLVALETNLRYREIPGAVAFLTALRNNRIPTALVTSSELWKVAEVFKQLEIARMFTVLVTAEDIQKGKPEPDCYRLAVERLGLAAERCLVFEDALSGVRAAINAGTQCMGVQSSANAEIILKAGALRVIPNFWALKYHFADCLGSTAGKCSLPEIIIEA